MADLEVTGLTVEFRMADYVVRPVEDFSLRAPSGHMVLLLGPSGSGKTTILSCLAGILSPTAGDIRVNGTSVPGLQGEDLARYRRETVGIAFQAFNLIPSLTALENVEVGMRLSGRPRSEARARATELLERFGLQDRLRNRPAQLSGGQQQRVAIARALAHDPPLVIADEPTASLDYVQAESVIGAIRDLAAPGRLVVIATHDERMIPLADQVIELTANFRNLSSPPENIALPPGTYLFRQGDAAERIYMVESGEIEIVRESADGGQHVLAVRGPGRYFGELGPLFGLRRTAAARARTSARVTGYTLRDFRKLFGDDPALGKLLAHAVGGESAPAERPAQSNGERTPEIRRALSDLGSAVRAWWRGG